MFKSNLILNEEHWKYNSNCRIDGESLIMIGQVGLGPIGEAICKDDFPSGLRLLELDAAFTGASEFCIRLMSYSNVAYLFNPRIGYHFNSSIQGSSPEHVSCIVQNTNVLGVWGIEERLELPEEWQPKNQYEEIKFQVSIEINHDYLTVQMKDRMSGKPVGFSRYKHRDVNPSEINGIQFASIFSTLRIDSVTVETRDTPNQLGSSVSPLPLPLTPTGQQTPDLIELTLDDRKYLREALIDAFPERSRLEMMLEDTFEERIMNKLRDGYDYEVTVNMVIRWAETNGKVQELLNGAVSENPGNLKLKKFVEKVS